MGPTRPECYFRFGEHPFSASRYELLARTHGFLPKESRELVGVRAVTSNVSLDSEIVPPLLFQQGPRRYLFLVLHSFRLSIFSIAHFERDEKQNAGAIQNEGQHNLHDRYCMHPSKRFMI